MAPGTGRASAFSPRASSECPVWPPGTAPASRRALPTAVRSAFLQLERYVITRKARDGCRHPVRPFTPPQPTFSFGLLSGSPHIQTLVCYSRESAHLFSAPSWPVLRGHLEVMGVLGGPFSLTFVEGCLLCSESAPVLLDYGDRSKEVQYCTSVCRAQYTLLPAQR